MPLEANSSLLKQTKINCFSLVLHIPAHPIFLGKHQRLVIGYSSTPQDVLTQCILWCILILLCDEEKKSYSAQQETTRWFCKTYNTNTAWSDIQSSNLLSQQGYFAHRRKIVLFDDLALELDFKCILHILPYKTSLGEIGIAMRYRVFSYRRCLNSNRTISISSCLSCRWFMHRNPKHDLDNKQLGEN